MVGQRQKAKMAYQIQAWYAREDDPDPDQVIKLFLADIEQRYLDEYAERLTFAINTARDRVWKKTQFYLFHGWDARSTLRSTLPIRSPEYEPSRWRYRIQGQYQ